MNGDHACVHPVGVPLYVCWLSEVCSLCYTVIDIDLYSMYTICGHVLLNTHIHTYMYVLMVYATQDNCKQITLYALKY